MSIRGVVGSKNKVNNEILIEACKDYPSILLDCSKSIGLDLTVDKISDEALKSVFVIETESIHKLEYILKEFFQASSELLTKKIFITSFNSKFTNENYFDEKEKEGDYNFWKLLKDLSEKDNYDIVVGICKNSDFHISLAEKNCSEILMLDD